MIILALGTNLGNRIKHLQDAVNALKCHGEIVDISPIYETEPWGFQSDNGFLNIVLSYKTELSPTNLLHETQKIERALGRMAKTTTEYTDRPIDIDIIDYNGLILNSNELVLPHPLMQNRNFVLYPLVDIAPEWKHPLLNISANQLKQESPDSQIPIKSTCAIDK